MYCPKCRGEYRDGISRCSTCEIDLVAELPPEDVFTSPETMAKALADKELKPLLMSSYAALEERQRMLTRERVATLIARESEDEEHDDAGVHTRFYLLVAAEELERARAVLQKHWQDGAANEGLAIADATMNAGACPACGTAVSDDDAECPECGLYLGEPEEATAKEEQEER